jgi:acyl-CoA thioesterase FadM
MSDFSETKVRVRYKETDQMGVVYYGNYLLATQKTATTKLDTHAHLKNNRVFIDDL